MDREQGFTQLYERYYTVIYKHMYHVMRHHELAEDLTQETFIRAWKAYDSLDASLNIGGYLYRVAIHRVYSYFSTCKKDVPLEETYLHEQADIAETYISHETHREKLALIPVDIQYAFIMHYDRGYPFKAIAQTLRITDRTLRNRIERWSKQQAIA